MKEVPHARLLRLEPHVILRITVGGEIISDTEISSANIAALVADGAQIVRDRFQSFTQDQTSNQTKEQ